MPSPFSIPLTMTEPALYKSEDMFREFSEGRSLHDDSNLFYRKVMGLDIPIKAVTQSTINEIHDAIDTKVSGTDFLMWSMVYPRNVKSSISSLISTLSTLPQIDCCVVGVTP